MGGLISDLPTNRPTFMGFSPRFSNAKAAREAIKPVAETFVHVVDDPIRFKVVTGIEGAKELRTLYELPDDFRGCVIAEPVLTRYTNRQTNQQRMVLTGWKIYKYPSLSSEGSISTSRVKSFVHEYLDTWSDSGRDKLEVTTIEVSK